jgi:hypothetical protein
MTCTPAVPFTEGQRDVAFRSLLAMHRSGAVTCRHARWDIALEAACAAVGDDSTTYSLFQTDTDWIWQKDSVLAGFVTPIQIFV